MITAVRKRCFDLQSEEYLPTILYKLHFSLEENTSLMACFKMEVIHLKFYSLKNLQIFFENSVKKLTVSFLFLQR